MTPKNIYYGINAQTSDEESLITFKQRISKSN